MRFTGMHFRVRVGDVINVVLLLVCGAVDGQGPRDLVFVVLSQEESSHLQTRAHILRQDLQEQARALEQVNPVVHLVHEEFPHPGAWTVLPLLPRLNSLHGANSSWVIFCESHTKFNLPILLALLSKFDETKELWLGHGLWDREATIVHHFASLQHFKYPHIASGVVFSAAILQRLSSRLEDETPPKTDFSIDPSHELSLYVWNKGRGTALSHSDLLCLHKQPHCASYVVPFQPCADPVPNRSIYFAVKTCGKFHKDRIPVVKSTWAKYARYIGFYSELEDNSIPTINVGVANTDHGHCGKTLAILSHVAGLSGGLPDVRWVVVADDDTILSVARLQQLLSCFNSSRPVAVGERYGYNVQRSSQGYNYITGGGGMVFSLVLVRKLVDSGLCRCPSISTPDDMFLGVCLARLGVHITHSPLFHQARPVDYAPEYLTMHDPVSFHKHWMIDPVGVYQDWFAEFDRRSELEVDQHKHLEL
uniref:Fringe-like glycosyltransferase domain-containing protein n=1 Tax=Timema monikensis TaxID=170555 RepID=A0A7R9E7X2_9NEOP|nr:unnamed protein product [Timema monikensis]